MGAVVAHTAMKLGGVKIASICPWAGREGVLLRYIEDGPDWWTGLGEAEPDPDPASTIHLVRPREGDALTPTG